MKSWLTIPKEERAAIAAQMLFERNNKEIPIRKPFKDYAHAINSYMRANRHDEALSEIQSCQDADEAESIFEIIIQYAPIFWYQFAKNRTLMEGLSSQALAYLLDKTDSALQDKKGSLWQHALKQIGVLVASNSLLCRRVGYNSLIPYMRHNHRLRACILGNPEFIRHLDYIELGKLFRLLEQPKNLIDVILKNIHVANGVEKERALYWAASALEHIAKDTFIGEYVIKREKNRICEYLGDFLHAKLKENVHRQFAAKYAYSKLHALVMPSELEEKMMHLDLNENERPLSKPRIASVPAPLPRMWQANFEDAPKMLKRAQAFANLPEVAVEEEIVVQQPVSYTPLRDFKLVKSRKSNDVFLQGQQADEVHTRERSRSPKTGRNRNIFKRIVDWCS